MMQAYVLTQLILYLIKIKHRPKVAGGYHVTSIPQMYWQCTQCTNIQPCEKKVGNKFGSFKLIDSMEHNYQ